LANKLIKRELKTILGFSCAKTDALNHIAVPTATKSWKSSINAGRFFNANEAAIDPIQLEAIIPRTIPR